MKVDGDAGTAASIAALVLLAAAVLYFVYKVRELGDHDVRAHHRPDHHAARLALEVRHRDPLERINTVFFNQRILERLGAGDLSIESAGERGTEHLRHPQACARAARDLRADGAARTASSTGPRPGRQASLSTTAEQLEKLHGLVQQGAREPSSRPRRRSCSDREPGASSSASSRRSPRRCWPGIGRWPARFCEQPTCRPSAGPRTRTSRRWCGSLRLVVMCDEENRRGRRRAGRRRRRRGARLLAPVGGGVGPALVALAGAVGAAPRAGAGPGPRAAPACGVRADLAPPVDVDGAETYGASVLGALGVENVCAGAAAAVPGGRSRRRAGATARRRLAPSEPYPFGPAPRRARGGRTGPGRRPGPVLVGRADARGRRAPPRHQLAKLKRGRRRRLAPPLGERTASRRRDDAAPEATPGHAGAVHAVGRGEPVHERVDLRARTRRSRRGGWRGWPPAGVGARRRRHAARPPCPGPAGSRSARGGPGAAARRRRWTARRPVGPVAAGRCGPQPPRTPAAGRRTRSRRGCRRRVHHDHLDVGGQRHRLDRVVAVDAQRVALAAEVSWSMIPQGTPDAAAPPVARAGRAPGVRVGAEGEATASSRMRSRRGRPTGRVVVTWPRSPAEGDLGDDAGHVGRPGRRVGRPRPVQPDDRRLRLGVRAGSTRSPPRVPTTVVPRSIAIGSTRPPVVSVWSPMRLTRPGANVAICVTRARSPSLDRLVKQGEDGRHAHRTAERRRHRALLRDLR